MDWHKRAQEELQEKAEWRDRDIQVFLFNNKNDYLQIFLKI